ncbi:unnamed protein product [Schistosoma margrebowiei]|uniref:Uncharacterized protein n=1 Tax=Schistosoma margrebowiei TaxID=48269 RepID=A0AA84ZFK6_9TREM|nr:unnamed protein product [Schistosoma margrebowiei]
MGLYQMVCRFSKVSSWLYKSFDSSSTTMFKHGHFSNKTLDFLSLHSMIETVEQNRDGFLKEVSHEYRSFSNFDIYDSKTTSFSVKLGCYENDGMFMLINASSGLSSDLS